MPKKNWKSYEEVATYLLNQFAEKFGLGRFEGKQIVPGECGTDWEIDAKGYSEDECHFVVVECKCHTKSGVSQALTARLAFVIQDTGAAGGILVSPLGLQDGAKKIAVKAGIHEVRLDKDSTTTDYVLRFLNQICVGLSDTNSVNVTDTLSIIVMDKDGNVIEASNLNGEITGAHSALDAGDKLREGDKWWSPDSSFTQCFNSGGPAAK